MVFEILQLAAFPDADGASDSFFDQKPSALCWLLWFQIRSLSLSFITAAESKT